MGAYDLQRIGAYVALLDLALSLSTTAFVGRVTAAINHHLVGHEKAPEAQAAGALEEMRSALGAAAATLTIESKNAVAMMRVACPEYARDISEADAFRVVLVKRSERHYTTTVSLGRSESLQFTPRDHSAASAVAAMFDVWASATLGGSSTRRERRAAPRGFQELLQRSAREALVRGTPVAVVVLLIRDAASLPGSTQRWVAEIRAQLRVSDLAGMLDEGEIGLLMHDAAADQAKGIAERLRTVVGEEPGSESILVGVTSRKPGQGAIDNIVHDAREDALARRNRQLSDSPHGVNR
jgi:hypothetical protein